MNDINNLPTISSLPAVKFIVTRTFVVIFCGIIAISVPKFGLFLDFIGAFTGTVLCFILPVLFYNKTFHGSISCSRKVVNWGILIIGCTFGGISAGASFISLIKAFFASE